MRIETVNGRHLLCGHILKNEQIEIGQTWAPADGSNREVLIVAREDDWVEYEWVEGGQTKRHQKLSFAFQCRYCLVLEQPNIPEGLK